MSDSVTRRQFLVTAGAATVTVLGWPMLHVESASATAPHVRRNLGGMAATNPLLVSYRKAIKAMKLRPSSDPLSWAYQAAIHGTTMSGSYPAWNTCEHGTPYFWSWHRMYLYWFERIVRKESGDSSWALPYWNYHAPTQRHLPAPFRDPSSELYESDRGPGWNAGTASYAAAHVDPTSGNSFVDYFSAQSGLESNPHDNVHVDMGGLMGDPSTAAADPVFFVHHSNIDRLWDLWIAQGAGRADPLSTLSWKNKSYTFFDENSNAINMTTCEILRAAEQLDYRYESEPPQVKQYCKPIIKIPPYYFTSEVLIHWPGPPVELTGEEVSIEIDIKGMRERLRQLAESRTELLVLELNDVEAERAPGAVWEVYLGLGANAAANAESPFFVGTVALFAAGVRAHAHGEFTPAHFTFRVGRAVLAALRSNQERLRLVFVPSGPLVGGKSTRPKVDAPVHVGSVNLSIGTQRRGAPGPS